MGRRVVVIASGETERRALPHLTHHLQAEGVSVLAVRVPPRQRALSLTMAEKLIKSVWFERPNPLPDKFVVLLDVDGKTPADVLAPFRNQLPSRLGPAITASIQFAYAQWHLEAWYFADEGGLRAYLGTSLGSVDSSAPDEIQNPKEHLKHLLLPRVYTSLVSEQIAKAVDAEKIAQRSLSFAGFLRAVRNGASA